MKTWFITGASRGFGRIWAEAALARGDARAAYRQRLDTWNAWRPLAAKA
jgi:NAD(P)-dependent dehydrogenase (short-subunit alcohol dehydrogenase family)